MTSSKSADLIDGYVLSFAKVNHQTQSKFDSSSGKTAINNNSEQQPTAADSAARISNLSPHLHSTGANNLAPVQGVEQWQAIQLAPQQRSHHLKNLECGTSYAMKIWAFNKVGKGEPSDLVTVSTRGKGK